MRFLSPDSGFMRALGDLIDAIWINILMLVTSIPVVTVGAALSAGHDAARRSLAGEGHVTSNYFKAFRSNFLKATALWAVFGLVGAGLVYSWIVLQITPLLIPKVGLSLMWLIGFEWVFALQARFENPVGRTFANAFVFGVTRLGHTLAMAAIDVLYVALLVLSWFFMPQGLFFLVLLGYGSMVMIHIPILEHAFKPYTTK